MPWFKVFSRLIFSDFKPAFPKKQSRHKTPFTLNRHLSLIANLIFVGASVETMKKLHFRMGKINSWKTEKRRHTLVSRVNYPCILNKLSMLIFLVKTETCRWETAKKFVHSQWSSKNKNFSAHLINVARKGPNYY